MQATKEQSRIMTSFVFDKILIGFGLILLFTLFIGTQAGVTYDVAYPDHLLLNEDHNALDNIHYMAKRRFLPTRLKAKKKIRIQRQNVIF
ncbi:unnamed protein product [Adineta ricciae]|uniref:Uncharacterized protein n=1 Tax=Adineta ricciae TaxID=249248 RepID=A0A813Z2M2_ADIRI|nr:unnamed protein product [Adineta ricciae]